MGPKELLIFWFKTETGNELALVAHEFGHAFGLSHEDGGIMTPTQGWEQLDGQTLAPNMITKDMCTKILNELR